MFQEIGVCSAKFGFGGGTFHVVVSKTSEEGAESANLNSRVGVNKGDVVGVVAQRVQGH